MTRIVFHPAAGAEVIESAEWYQSRVPDLGASFLDEVDAAISRIASAPEAFGKVLHDIRMHLLHRFPYGIIYRVETDRIFVIAVMHLHRDPNYWKGRV